MEEDLKKKKIEEDLEKRKGAKLALKKCGFRGNIFHSGGAPSKKTIIPAGLESQKEKVMDWITNFLIESGAEKDLGNVFCGVILGEYGKGKSTFLRYIEFLNIQMREESNYVIGYMMASDSLKKGLWKFSDLAIELIKTAIKNKTLTEENFNKLKQKYDETEDIKDTINYGLNELSIKGFVLLFDELEEVLNEISKDDEKMEQFLADIRTLNDEGGATLLLFSCTYIAWRLVSGSPGEDDVFGYLKTRIGDKTIDLPDFTADIANEFISNALKNSNYINDPSDPPKNPFKFNSIRSLILATNYSGRFFNILGAEIFGRACLDGINHGFNYCAKIDYERVINSLKTHSKYFNDNLYELLLGKLKVEFQDDEEILAAQEILKLMIGEFGEYTAEDIAERLDIKKEIVENVLKFLTIAKIEEVDEEYPPITSVFEIDLSDVKGLIDLKNKAPSRCKHLFIGDDTFLEKLNYNYEEVIHFINSGMKIYFLPENKDNIRFLFNCRDDQADSIKLLFTQIRKNDTKFFRVSESLYKRLFKMSRVESEIDFGFVIEKNKREKLKNEYNKLDMKQKYARSLKGLKISIEHNTSKSNPKEFLEPEILTEEKLILGFKIRDREDLCFNLSILFYTDKIDDNFIETILEDFYENQLFAGEQGSKLGLIVTSKKKIDDLEKSPIFAKNIDLIDLPIRNFLKNVEVFEDMIEKLIMLSYTDEIEEEEINEKYFKDQIDDIRMSLYLPIIDSYKNWINKNAQENGLYISNAYQWGSLKSDYKATLEEEERIMKYYLNKDENVEFKIFKFNQPQIKLITSGKLKPFLIKEGDYLKMIKTKEEILILKIICNFYKRDPDGELYLYHLSNYFYSKIDLSLALMVYLDDLELKNFIEISILDKDDYDQTIISLKDFTTNLNHLRSCFETYEDKNYVTNLDGKVDDECKDRKECFSTPKTFWDSSTKDDDVLTKLNTKKMELIKIFQKHLPDLELSNNFFSDNIKLFEAKLNEMIEFINIEKYFDVWPKVFWKIEDIYRAIRKIDDFYEDAGKSCKHYCDMYYKLESQDYDEEEQDDVEDEESEEFDIEQELEFPDWGF